MMVIGEDDGKGTQQRRREDRVQLGTREEKRRPREYGNPIVGLVGPIQRREMGGERGG